MSRMQNKSGNGAKEMRVSDALKKIRGRLKQRVNTAKALRMSHCIFAKACTNIKHRVFKSKARKRTFAKKKRITA